MNNINAKIHGSMILQRKERKKIKEEKNYIQDKMLCNLVDCGFIFI